MTDFEDYFSRALASPRGISLLLESEAAAIRFRGGMNKYRAKLRRQAEDFGLPARSIYDGLELVIPKNEPRKVLIRPRAIDAIEVEEL